MALHRTRGRPRTMSLIQWVVAGLALAFLTAWWAAAADVAMWTTPISPQEAQIGELTQGQLHTDAVTALSTSIPRDRTAVRRGRPPSGRTTAAKPTARPMVMLLPALVTIMAAFGAALFSYFLRARRAQEPMETLALAAMSGSPDSEPLITKVLERSFSLDLVPGEAAEEYRFDATKLANPQRAAASLTAADVADEQLLRHLRQESTDEELNVTLWKCLGYRLAGGAWDNTNVFPKFREQHPSPPDFIGVTRTYTQAVDEPSLLAVQQLHKTVPAKYVAALKETFRPLGWKGYQLDELNPNRRRRAMTVQWLLFYRAELFGMSLEELQRRRQNRQAGAQASP